MRGVRHPKRIGPLGLRELLEPELRALVADRLGVEREWLTPDASLAHDLAVDSARLAEVVVEVERRFGVIIDEPVMDRLQSYGDLVDAVIEARRDLPQPPGPAVFVRTAVRPRRDGRAIVARSAWLSPYTVETIGADARRAGPGATLAITVSAGAPFATIAHVERAFAFLAHLGVAVEVKHEQIGRRRAVA